jgi:hypothetical protein
MEATLSEERRMSLIRTVPFILQPVIRRGRAGLYEPEPGEVDLAAVAGAIILATGAPSRGILPVSLQDDRGLALLQRRPYGRTLEEAVERAHAETVRSRLGVRRWSQMRRQFGYGESACEHLEASGLDVPRRNLRSCLFHCYGLVFAWEADAAESFFPLMRLLPTAVPLGELAGRPGTWAVLVA